MAAKVTVNIRNVAWRATDPLDPVRTGRPRFVPGTALRAQGYKGKDLRHPDGRWFTLDEAEDWSRTFQLERDGKVVAGTPTVAAKGKQKPTRYTTVGQLIDSLFDLPEFVAYEDPDERLRHEALAPATIRWYRGIADVLKDYDAQLWTSPVAAVSRLVAKGFRRKVVAAKGLSTARALIALLSRAFNEVDHVVAHPWRKLRLKTPPPRLNAVEPEAIDVLIAAADAVGRADIGDAIMLGVCTGQRQNDRLNLTEAGRVDGAILFRQMKTGAVVTLPILDRLAARLTAAKARRKGATVQWPHVLIDERLNRPWPTDGDYYRRAFATIRDAAAKQRTDLKGFHDQDLRDTAVTWLARAGCTIPEIVSITGHELETATQILRHYLGRHPELARTAMAKVAAWLDARGARSENEGLT